MIQLSKNYSLPEREEEIVCIKFIGVGGAGSNALDRLVLDGMDKADLIAINTDVQSLASSVAANKVQLGRSVTRGLGAGGDPEVGHHAAMESAEEIRQLLTSARLIFICAGLGGGTGSGAAPVVAQLAREAGSLVVALATLPFAFEGKRRGAQAQAALGQLRDIAHAVICFENDLMGDMVAPKAGIHQAFATADITISQSVRSIINLIQRPGLIRIGFDDLLTALRSENGRCLFGYGESDSGNRAHDALRQALKNPLMDKGKMLADASHVLVQVAGGPAMTLAEVEILMQEFGRYISERTQIIFGTAIDSRMGNRLSVTIISSLAGQGEHVPQQTVASVAAAAAPAPLASEEPPADTRSIDITPETTIPEPTDVTENLIAFEEAAAVPPRPSEPEIKSPVPAPRLIVPKKKPTSASTPASEPKSANPKSVQPKQEVLQFEPVTRGRFEKSEPTIVEGQDLDVPTFLRKNIRVK